MFGYIKVDRANLLGKEYEAYKGIYCSLCRQLGRDYSIFARFILSYDCTFYAMLIMSLSEETPCYRKGRCRFNPAKKCLYADTGTQALSLAAALSVSSAYYKLIDNIHDSPWYKRMLYRLLQPIFSRWRRKAGKRYPAIDAAVGQMLARQIAAESSPDVSIDAAAQPTADMLAAVCALIPDTVPLSSPDNERTKRILSAFGYFLGRWIYLIDAADDYEKDIKRVAVVGGGVGCAIAYPQAKKLHNMGVYVDLIAGFRNKDIVIIEDEMRQASNELHICTDDGSYGCHGFVTNKLQELIDKGNKYDMVIAIGPVPMMKFVCKVTEPYGIKTLVSLNPIMVDGTGMCGGCRVRVDGKIRYACVDGPDFDGHRVDFDELIRRNSTYKEQEKAHKCRITGEVR